MMSIIAVFALVAGVSALPPAQWDELNARARNEACRPIRPGVPGVRPFWNGKSIAFLRPPAFDFGAIAGAKAYRFTLTEGESGVSRAFVAAHPWAPLTPVWRDLADGPVALRVEGLDGGGRPCGIVGERRFHRAAAFCGPYPEPKGDYRAAARRCFSAMAKLPYVRAWLQSDEPPEGYELYCYPSKIMAAIVRALVFDHQSAGPSGDDSLAIAKKIADWLIAHSAGADSAVAFLPPTYWGNRRGCAVTYRGQNMLVYPAEAALAYLALFDCCSDVRYRDAALAIAATMLKLQGPDGTWPLKVYEKDASPVRPNRMFPEKSLCALMERASAITGDDAYRAAIEKSRAAVLKGPCVTWNWDGQFEDIDPMPPYVNLQRGSAAEFAEWLLSVGRIDEGLELVDWCEDQFVVWSNPVHHMEWRTWKLPTALEQYEYYTPIDAAMCTMIRAFAAAWKATGDRLYYEKAKALADCLVRHQRADGTIPTYFSGRKSCDWLNCMLVSAETLLTFGDCASRP